MLLFLEGVKPISYVVFQVTLFSTAPFLMLFGHHGDLGTKLMLLLQRKESVERLVSRIQEKQAERSKKHNQEPDGAKNNSPENHAPESF